MRTGPARGPRVLHVIACCYAIPADRDIGAVTHVQPDLSSLGRFGGERELEEQVIRRQGDAPGDQVVPVGDLADFEIEWVRNPGLWRRGSGAPRCLADPRRKADGGSGPRPGRASESAWDSH